MKGKVKKLISPDFESEIDLYEFPGNKIALRFTDSITSESKREICKSFWKTLDSDEKCNLIMEHGRYINQPAEEKKPSIKKPKPAHFCQLPAKKKLQEFIRLGMDKAAIPEKRNKNLAKERACFNLKDYEEPVNDMRTDLDSFNDKVVVEPLIKYNRLLKPPQLPKIKNEGEV